MTVWTIASQAGSEGEQVAHLLAEQARVPLVRPETVAADRGASECRGRIGRLTTLMSDLALSGTTGFVAPVDVLSARTEVPRGRDVIESVIREAARWPAVVLDWSAFAVLAEHPGACHVRVQAPLEWRVCSYARANCLSRQQAKRALERLDRQRNESVERAYGRKLDSPENFTIVCDASRFSVDELVGVLLAAGKCAVAAD
jgi:Cytidylate kinase-like family